MRRTRGSFIGALTTAVSCLISPGSLVAQSAPPQVAAAKTPKPTDDTLVLAQGWGFLAAGDAARAAQRADDVLARQPHSVAAASLRVEAEIVRGGSTSGLAAYESWLANRRLEDGYLLRRVARAGLWELTARPETAAAALEALAADGDPEARAALTQRMAAGGRAETRALARMGDTGAIKRLINQLETGKGSKLIEIESLIQSGSALAIPPLMRLLNDTNFPDHVAASAEGLGVLKATQSINELRRVYQAQDELPNTRFFAAIGLFRMGDMTGIGLLQQRLASEFPHVALDTARRMASQPDATWHTVVRQGVRDPDPAVRVIAAELLAPYDRQQATGELERLMTDENYAIRQKAARTFVATLAADFGSLRRFLRVTDASIRVASSGRILELSR